jgi:hypothetical protein
VVLDEDTSVIRSSTIRQIFYSFCVHALPFIVITAWDVMMPFNELVLRVGLKDVCVVTSSPQEQLLMDACDWVPTYGLLSSKFFRGSPDKRLPFNI